MLSRFSSVQLFMILWTIACQGPLSMGFSRQEYWSEFPCSPSGTLPDPGIESASFMSPTLASGFLFCFVLFLSYLGSPCQWWGVGLEKNGKRCTCKQMGQQTKKNSLMEESTKEMLHEQSRSWVLEVTGGRRGGEQRREKTPWSSSSTNLKFLLHLKFLLQDSLSSDQSEKDGLLEKQSWRDVDLEIVQR